MTGACTHCPKLTGAAAPVAPALTRALIPYTIKLSTYIAVFFIFQMAICRYWQQGSCSFGSTCRFEHVGAAGRPAGNVFAGSASTGSNENIINTLVTTVKQDIEQSTKGKQWLFSCYR